VKVSELAGHVGVSAAAIRFYEAEGILPAPSRAGNGYREYSDADLCRLRIVVSLRGLGLELGESGRLAALCADDRCDDMADQLAVRLADRRAAVAAARAELDHLDSELAKLQESLASGQPKPSLCQGKEVSSMLRCDCPCDDTCPCGC